MTTLREHLEAIRECGGALPDSRVYEHAVAALRSLDDAPVRFDAQPGGNTYTDQWVHRYVMLSDPKSAK